MAVDSRKCNATRFVFAGGGTGGHLYPAIALASELKRRIAGCEIVFVGTVKGIESRVLPPLGWQLRTIAVRGLRRKITCENIQFPFRLMVSCFQSLTLLRELRPAVVIGTGGYVSGPVLFVAALLRIPRLIQEQNVRPGATTRLLAKIVDRVHLSYPESLPCFKARGNLHVSGNPVRAEKTELSLKEARAKIGIAAQRKTVLIFGGSQGAHSINRTVMSMLGRLLKRREVQVIWGSGYADYQEAAALTGEHKERVWLKPYIDDMPTVYRASDVVICRAGAITLSEIQIYGIPAILVPYPFAAAGHQEWNARAVAAQGAARVILDGELTPERLLSELVELLDNDALREKMRGRMSALARPQATGEIVDSILALAACEAERVG